MRYLSLKFRSIRPIYVERGLAAKRHTFAPMMCKPLWKMARFVHCSQQSRLNTASKQGAVRSHRGVHGTLLRPGIHRIGIGDLYERHLDSIVFWTVE